MEIIPTAIDWGWWFNSSLLVVLFGWEDYIYICGFFSFVNNKLSRCFWEIDTYFLLVSYLLLHRSTIGLVLDIVSSHKRLLSKYSKRNNWTDGTKFDKINWNKWFDFASGCICYNVVPSTKYIVVIKHKKTHLHFPVIQQTFCF